MQGRDFALCEDEQILAKKAAKISHQHAKARSLSSEEELQKAMEIFHLLVFLETASCIPKPKRISPHEPLDAIVQFRKLFNKDIFWRNLVGFEIVTCFGAEKNSFGKQISSGGHPAIDEIVKNLIKDSEVNIGYLSLPDTKSFRAQFISEIANKQGKNYEIAGVTKRALLIVTGEPSDAGCPITGSWHEKTLKYDELGINKDKFDRLCVLDYFSSGKDNGPTAVLDLTEEQKFYDLLFHK